MMALLKWICLVLLIAIYFNSLKLEAFKVRFSNFNLMLILTLHNV